MKRPAIFFDRDNTLIANDGYLGDPEQVRLIPGAADAVARARTMGYAVVTVSNQSGVARGMFDEAAVHAVNRRMDELLRAENPDAVIDRHEFCPFHPEAKVTHYRQESPLRKPSPGMIHKAAIMMDLDTQKSWVVGDAPRDIDAGRAAGCRTILFADPQLPKSPAAEGKVRAEFVVPTLDEAMKIIDRERGRRPGRIPPPSPVTPQLPPAPVAQEVPLPTTTSSLESTAQQILHELRRRHEHNHSDFTVPKLLAGILQVTVLAVLFVGYLSQQNAASLQTLLLLAAIMQGMVISLLLMGKK